MTPRLKLHTNRPKAKCGVCAGNRAKRQARQEADRLRRDLQLLEDAAASTCAYAQELRQRLKEIE